MKKLALALLVLCFAQANAAQVITGFGTSEYNPFANDMGIWSYTSTLTSVSVTNVSDMDDPAIFSTLANQVSIIGQPLLRLNGSFDSSITGVIDQFRITLYDTNNYAAYANYTWSSFIGGAAISSTLVNDLSSGGVFDAQHVQYWGLNTFGNGKSISFTFNDLSATTVPEPSVMMLVGAAMSGLALCRAARRKI